MGWFNKKKKSNNDFFKLLADALKDANENAQKTHDAIFQNQRPYDKDFGLCEQNPIFTSSLMGTEQYLSKVCTKKQEKFTWVRCRSIRTTVGTQRDVAEDVYTIYLNGNIYTELFFVMYCGESDAPPAGLYFYGDNTDWDIKREAYEKGVTVDQLVAIRQMELELDQEKERKEKEFKRSVEQKASSLKLKYPNISIDEELQNKIFYYLISVNIDLMVVYEYIHKDDLFFKKKTMPTTSVECLNAKYFYDIMHQLELEEKQKREATIQNRRGDVQQEAVARGITIDQVIKIRNMETNNAKLKWEMRMKKLHDFSNQALVIKSTYPSFDLSQEWKNNIFREITEKFGMLIAYESLHFSECYVQEIPNNNTIEPQIDTSLENILDETASVGDNVAETFLFCRKCGTKLLHDSTFCHKCGTKIIIVE